MFTDANGRKLRSAGCLRVGCASMAALLLMGVCVALVDNTMSTDEPGGPQRRAVLTATAVACDTRTGLRNAWNYPDDPFPVGWLENQGCRWRTVGDTVVIRSGPDGMMIQVEPYGWTSTLGVEELSGP